MALPGHQRTMFNEELALAGLSRDPKSGIYRIQFRLWGKPYNKGLKSRGLKALEQVGLIAVQRRPGRDPLASLLTGQVFTGETRQEWVAGKFLRGPIPLTWLGRVARLPGQKVLAVALAIWFRVGLYGRKDGLKLTSAVLARFGVEDRSTKSRALGRLEAAGLIRVQRQSGKNPLVTIIENDARASVA
jgi:DNA-binding transcriptional ArsR family regulator